MSKTLTISINNSKEFEFLLKGDITKIIIETTDGEYVVDNIKPKKKITRKDLNTLLENSEHHKNNESESSKKMVSIEDILNLFS